MLTIATLAVGDYCAGAAALINSLACSDFRGHITVGHWGPLEWEMNGRAPISCVELQTAATRHPINLKAELLQSMGPGDICYIDADCIVTSPRLLEIVTEFLDVGPFFSIESILPASDVRHHVWRRSFIGLMRSDLNFMSCIPYINSGFFALRLPRDDYYLREFADLMQRALPDKGEVFKTPYFPLPDQDCLNAVVANAGRPIATLGPPDIWSRAVSTNPYALVGVSTTPLLLHCTGLQKTWRLKDPPLSRPDIYDKEFHRFAHLETPWVTLRRPLPKSVIHWIEDGAMSKATLKLRRLGSRLSHIGRTIANG